MPYIMRDGQVVLITDEEATEVRGPEPIKQIPPSVTNFQARAALKGAGLFDQIDALIIAGENGTADDQIAFQAWQFGNEFMRSSPTIALMAGALNLTDAQVDDLFLIASKIEA